jgi:Restriction endonuclease
VRQLAALSDIEFERLITDLLRAETGDAYERFGVGPDGGIDLRFVDVPAGTIEIVQCKHYIRSSFSQLESAARKEPPKLEAQTPGPTGYRFVTSQSLTVGQKDRLIEALGGWIEDPGRIWSAETIDDLLDAHQDVERRHVKLWLSSSTQLEQLLNAGTLNRSNDLIERIVQTLPRYVQTARFDDAEEVLREQGVCLIAGEPGIGKTTLAQMLLLECARQGFEALYISEDVSEGWDVLADRRQAFYYDDFLGRIGLAGMGKNEDQRLVDLIARAHRNPRRTRVILTTREYILRSAVQLYETFERAELAHERFLLALKDYSRYERGLVLYNHLYHSQAMKSQWLRQLVESEAYVEIVDHKNYNPRLIEFITGHAKPRELEHVGEDWVGFALAALDHPEEIWRRAFVRELDDLQRAMLLCMVSIGGSMEVREFRGAVLSYCDAAGVAFDDLAFGQSLKVLELTFFRFDHEGEQPTVDVANPSVSDFILNVLSEDVTQVRAVLDGAVFFAQPSQLWEVADAGQKSTMRERLAAALREESQALAEAFVRTFESRRVESSYLTISSFRSVLRRDSGREGRLRTIVLACGDVLAGDGKLSEWLSARIKELRDEWEERRSIVGSDAVALYEALIGGPCAGFAEDLGRGLKDALSYELGYAGDFEVLNDLWRADQSLFDHEDREDMVGEFVDYAEQALLDGEVNNEEIDLIERLAREFGVYLDGDDLSEARELASSREWEPEETDENRPAATKVSDRENSLEGLHELFGRLNREAEG